MKTPLLLGLMLVLSSASSAAPPVTPLAAREAQWQSFRAHAGNDWQVEWSRARRSPSVLRGNTPLQLGAGNTQESRAQAARAFFGENANLYGLRHALDEMSPVAEYTYGHMHFVKLEQRYRGIPVLSGGVSLAIDDNGALHMSTGNVASGITLDPSPRVTPEEALSLLSSTGVTALPKGRDAGGLVVAEVRGQPVLAYVIRGAAPNGQPTDFVVDAHSGDVVDQWDAALHATGSGNVYPKNSFDPITVVPLPRLDGTGEYLDGTNVSVWLNGVVSPRAHEPSTQYLYTPAPAPPATDQSHFDEVNAYYQIDRFLNDFLKTRLGFAGIANRPLVSVNSGGTLANDDPANSRTYLLFESAYPSSPSIRDAAKDVDLLWHEATHAVLFSLRIGRPFLGAPVEALALHEGMANYFACAFGEDPRWGEGTYLNFPNGEDSLTTNPAVFNYSRFYLVYMGASGAGNSHSEGAIWSGALWDIRKAIGWTADSLALQGMYYMPSSPDFVQAAYCYLQADIDYHGGRHVSTIISKFAARGIPVGVLSANITGPGEMNPRQNGTFNSNRAGGLKPFTYRWEQLDHCSCAQSTNCDSWRALSGNTATISTRSATSFDIRVTVTDSLNRIVTSQTYVNVRYICDGGSPAIAGQGLRLTVTPTNGNDLTSIRFGLGRAGHVRLDAFDVAGRRLAMLADGKFEAGDQTVLWDAHELPAGLYLVRLTRPDGPTETARFLRVH